MVQGRDCGTAGGMSVGSSSVVMREAWPYEKNISGFFFYPFAKFKKPPIISLLR
jgi:hypothetical protein